MLDIILSAVFLLIFWWGYKKGFIRIFRRVFGVFISYLAAYFLYKPVSGRLMQTSLKDKLYNAVAEKSTVGDAGISIDFSPEFLVKPIEDAINNGIRLVADNVVLTATGMIMSIIAAVLVFVVVMLGMNLVWMFLEKVAKLPLLRSVNKMAGMVIGAVSGLACVYIAGMVLISLSASNPKLELLITGSYIIKWMF